MLFLEVFYNFFLLIDSLLQKSILLLKFFRSFSILLKLRHVRQCLSVRLAWKIMPTGKLNTILKKSLPPERPRVRNEVQLSFLISLVKWQRRPSPRQGHVSLNCHTLANWPPLRDDRCLFGCEKWTIILIILGLILDWQSVIVMVLWLIFD